MSDEEFCLRLVEEHLSSEGKSGFSCDVNPHDPPDLLVTWDDGSRWGVEVTRTYQQVANQDRTSTISAAAITERLWAFGERVRESTENIRNRNYLLLLGPQAVGEDLADLLKNLADVSNGERMDFRKAWRVWQSKTEATIREHIEAEERGVLECPWIRLTPQGPGSELRIMVAANVAEIDGGIHLMLWQALRQKTNSLERWTGCFAQRWLLLLNAYPLVEDPGDVERTVRQLVRAHPDLRGLDGVFWSGYPDRTLVAIPIRSGE